MTFESDLFSSADKTQAGTVEFRQFRRKLFHISLSLMLESLRAGEKKPEVFQCPDGHYRRVVWGIGPYIADYPEQVLLTCIVQGWCPRLAILAFMINLSLISSLVDVRDVKRTLMANCPDIHVHVNIRKSSSGTYR